MRADILKQIRWLLMLVSFFAWNGLILFAIEPVPINFNEEIRPILSDNCFYCHGPDEGHREADLRLDVRQEAIDFLAIVPGQPEESELIRRIESTAADEVMPPPHTKKQIKPADLAKLKAWIKSGADYQQHWAFTPIVKPEPPPIKNVHGQPLGPIDAFVAVRMQEKRLQPNPPADTETLARRLCYDLTGLPPTLAQLDRLLATENPQTIEQFVDELLTSPHYGERMTTEWLDVARYSDSYGYQVDRDRFVWPWRDWVIRAFNQNMPYDQFMTEQLAGDLLDNPTDDQILATTFNRLHPQKVEGGSVPEEFRVEYIADRTQTFGTAFLGLTLECCRCHSHKYDPISIQEYYQFSAFFDNIDEAGLYSFFTNSVPTPTLLLANDQQKQQLKKLADNIEQAEARLQEIRAGQQDAWTDWLANERSKLLSAENALPVKGTEPELSGQSAGGQKAAESVAKPESDQQKKEPPAVVPHPLIPGRVAWLDFESGSFGANESVPGMIGQAVRLTGDDAINTTVGNYQRYEPFSVSLWLNIPDHKERAVVFHRSRAWTDAASRGYELLLEDGRLSAALCHYWPGNALRVQAIEPLPLNQWQHVTITYDGSSRAEGLKLYRNGAPIPCAVIRDKLTKNITGGGGDHISIGERFRDRGLKNGLVDDFQVYQRELTAIEVAELADLVSLQELLSRPVRELSAAELSDLQNYYFSNFNLPYREQLQQLQSLREQQSQTIEPIQEIMVMRETAEPVPSHVLTRGVYDAKAEQVYPQTPEFLFPFPDESPKNRLGLVRWLVSPQNPLTARVTVNRYWQMLFGEGLVRTPEDFGSQGQPPTHPLLLDWLAADFMENGWDVRRLLKQIVLTQTYQQSSAFTPEQLLVDPENRYLARFPRRRLPAEMIRDTALAVSGLLVSQIGGAPVHPYEVEASFKPTTRSSGNGLYRRSLYTYWKRNAPAPVMLALDASLRDVCRVKREKTMSPLQAFVLLNGPQFVEAGRFLAESAIKSHGTDAEKIIQNMFRKLTARYPDPQELEILLQLYQSQKAEFAANSEITKEFLQVGDKAADGELNPIELAAWSAVANTLLNFDLTQMQQ